MLIPKILVFNGSNRSGSLSGQVADNAARVLALAGADVTRIALADYPLPIMDEDLESQKGIPDNAVKLARLIAHHDGVLVATPEYNGSIPPLLKNVIDWVSRVIRDGGRPLKPYPGKVFALCSSSSGPFAGIRAINHLRAVLVHVGCEVVSPQCSVAHAQQAFDETGEFHDPRSRDVMGSVCETLLERARMLSTRVDS
jgi:NAD(P)H-dependent FMN reductase